MLFLAQSSQQGRGREEGGRVELAQPWPVRPRQPSLDHHGLDTETRPGGSLLGPAWPGGGFQRRDRPGLACLGWCYLCVAAQSPVSVKTTADAGTEQTGQTGPDSGDTGCIHPESDTARADRGDQGSVWARYYNDADSNRERGRCEAVIL